jgi:epsilon-lactone hydrolase
MRDQMPSLESVQIRQQIHKQGVPTESLEQQRQGWAGYAASLPSVPGTQLKNEVIAGVPCLWVTNQAADADQVIMYLHGGGLVDGSSLTHRELVSRMAQTIGCPIVMVDYRLAPEHPFPAALDDVIGVYEGLLTAKQYRSGQIIFGGDSSGAALEVAALVQLRNQQKPLPRKGFCISGAFDATLSGESMHSRVEIDPMMTLENLLDWQQYFPEALRSDPTFSPVFDELHDLPPILFQVGDHEVWLSDTLRMVQKVNASGGQATLRVWESMWHVWHMYSDLPEAKEAIEEIRDFLV